MLPVSSINTKFVSVALSTSPRQMTEAMIPIRGNSRWLTLRTSYNNYSDVVNCFSSQTHPFRRIFPPRILKHQTTHLSEESLNSKVYFGSTNCSKQCIASVGLVQVITDGFCSYSRITFPRSFIS